MLPQSILFPFASLVFIDGLPAILVTSPTAGAILSLSSPITVTWTSVVTDPSSFDILLVNNDGDCAPTGMSQVVRRNVSTADGRCQIEIATPVKPCGGYQIDFASNILAQSARFNLSEHAPSNCSNPTNTSSITTGNSTSTHLNSTNAHSNSNHPQHHSHHHSHSTKPNPSMTPGNSTPTHLNSTNAHANSHHPQHHSHHHSHSTKPTHFDIMNEATPLSNDTSANATGTSNGAALIGSSLPSWLSNVTSANPTGTSNGAALIGSSLPSWPILSTLLTASAFLAFV